MGEARWSGEMLDSPEMVSAFSGQLRGMLGEYAEFVARVRRDAEAMWDANPPSGYGTFEAWWRARWVKGPLAEIQEHLEAAAALTFKVESRYRRGRHELPAARQAKRDAKQVRRPQDAPALGAGGYGRRSAGSAGRGPSPDRGAAPAADFLDLVQGKERSA